jgi:hypothetical protein
MPSAIHPAKASTPWLDHYFEISIYLMVVSGFASLASTGEVNLSVIIFVLAGLLFRGYTLAVRRKFLIREAWTNAITLAYVAFYLADYFLISRAFLNATIHLVLFVMLVRLFSAKRERDYYFLAVLAFLMVLAAAVLTVDSLFLLAFAVFMLAAVATFILMEMRNSAARAQIQSRLDHPHSRQMVGSMARTAPAIVLLILLGAAAIFFILPRVSAGYFGAYAIRNELASGFSDRVELGQIGQIQQSSAVVMHVQIDGDAEGAYELKWRGVSLNQFDGRVWSTSHQQRLIFRLPDGSFPLAAPRPGGKMIHYRVLMEPLGTNIFFLASRAVMLQGQYRQISMDGGGAVFDVDAERPIAVYEALSQLSETADGQFRPTLDDYPEQMGGEDLQLPALDPRIPQLARQITGTAKTNYEKADALEKYLLTHFTYTLQLSRTTPRDPIAEFLFIRKQGHCEYFASSMAVMLRTLGIPARVVNGFRGAEFNSLTSQYLVRESDAHSWVEAYFPGKGWVTFDPTPGGPAPEHTAWSRLLL